MSQKKDLLIKEWTLRHHKVETNLGEQTSSFKCEVRKCYDRFSNLTLFEKYVLGYVDYYFKLIIKPVDTIKYTDIKYPVGYGHITNLGQIEFFLGGKRKNEKINLNLSHLVELSRDVIHKKVNPVKIQNEKTWKRHTFINKTFHNKNCNITIYSNIHPFHGDYLSGHTSIIELGFVNGSGGIGVRSVLFGFTIEMSSWGVYHFMRKILRIDEPTYMSGKDNYGDYMRIREQWCRKHRFKRLFAYEGEWAIGLNRVHGLFYKKLKPVQQIFQIKSINLLRNRLWRII